MECVEFRKFAGEKLFGQPDFFGCTA